MEKTIQYETSGTCCRLMQVTIDDNDTIVNVDFLGGCNGNLKGIKSLVTGMKVDDVISKLSVAASAFATIGHTLYPLL